MMIAVISISGKAIPLKDVCRQLGRQTSVEFYVDRRFEGRSAALHISSTKLETVMTCIEEVTGLQWRLVDDMFFLTEDARGAAVVRWKERYQEAKKTEVAKTTESRVQEWLYDVMPFPPTFDPEWDLTPLQREQIAYRDALSAFTMTPPQIAWLNGALRSKGFRTTTGAPTEILAQQSPDLAVKLNAAMVIDSPQGTLLIERPLTPPAPERPDTPVKTNKVTSAVPSSETPAKTPSLKGTLDGVWVTDDRPGDMTALLEAAKSHGMDNIFVPVLSLGATIYPSKVLHPDDTPTGPDRLRQIVDAAGKLGMKVHAVLDTTLWGDATHPLPAPARYAVVQDRNLLDRTYSEQEQWQRTELSALNLESIEETPPLPPAEQDLYLCPAASQTARLIRALVKEIAQNYDVAGICLDRLDYPQTAPLVLSGKNLATPFGYTIEVRKEMIRAHQLDPVDLDAESIRSPSDLEAQTTWDKFRRGKLTGLITDVAGELKAVNPDGICSVTLNAASDAQSPDHWSQIADVDALLPTVGLGSAGDGSVGDQEDVQAVNALYAAVSKYAAVVPVLRGSDMQGLLDLASALRPSSPDRGRILCGDSSRLVETLEALVTAGDQ
jgi:uncharacterized lipoprotein YddW (UPF0748 family)